MALNQTTLAAAAGVADTVISVSSATGFTAPNFTTGAGVSYCICDQELMLILGVSGTNITVQRGIGGTPAVAHASGANITAGLPADFSGQKPAITASTLQWVTIPVAYRAGAAQATSLVGTAATTSVDTNFKAAVIEIMNTLIAMGIWKGGA